MRITIPWPLPEAGPCLVPVFLPFSGCPTRCIFCAQHLQTGTTEQDIVPLLQNLEETLRQRARQDLELGFFGGTFTLQKEERLETCLELVRRCRSAGLLRTARCSTRPDAISPAIVQRLRHAGFSMVELGIQSFHNDALRATQRGYDRETALRACDQIHAAGLKLCIQLMPGMPGSNAESFLQDIDLALEVHTQALRFYPCLVIQGTALEQLFLRGDYRPWTLEESLPILAQGWRTATQHAVPVIRTGLAPEPGLRAMIVAGPHHPALGALVQAEALLLTVKDALRQKKAGLLRSLTIPRHCQGFFWGQQRQLERRWLELGLHRRSLFYHDKPELILECST